MAARTPTHFVSDCCHGERCAICGAPATHKIGEELQFDDPDTTPQNLTAYVCCAHFRLLFGSAAPCCAQLPVAVGDALTWRDQPPAAEVALAPASEEYFWARGGNFNRPVMVRVICGVRFVPHAEPRRARPELNFTFMAENYPSHIWFSELGRWPGLSNLQWAGPVARPGNAPLASCLVPVPYLQWTGPVANTEHRTAH